MAGELHPMADTKAVGDPRLNEDVASRKGTYHADGDPWIYKVLEDGSVTAIKDGVEKRVADGSQAWDAIIAQIDKGQLKKDETDVSSKPPSAEKSFDSKPLGGYQDKKDRLIDFKMKAEPIPEYKIGKPHTEGGDVYTPYKPAGEQIKDAAKAFADTAGTVKAVSDTVRHPLMKAGSMMVKKLREKYGQADKTLSDYNSTIKGGGTNVSGQ
jgi:hypothetical protein